MQGTSRTSLTVSRDQLGQAVRSEGVDAARVGDELFGVTALLDGNGALRRAIADPSGDPEAKRGLADQVFGGRVSDQTVEVLRVVAGQRWSADRDLTDSLELLGVEAVLTSAERAGRIDQVEDELFRFERIVAGNAGLRDALMDRQRSGEDKAALVNGLLDGKAAPETVRLATEAAAHPRGRRYERVLQSFTQVAATLREQLTATVVAAIPLADEQRQRLTQALSSLYNRPVQTNVIVDPQVVGGLRVLVGDEVIDGTIVARLEDARRHLAG